MYLLRHILHDWPNAECVTILRHLRAAATPGLTKLLIVESVVLYASPVRDGDEFASVPGVLPPSVPPPPLLPNLGRAALDTHNFDFVVSSSIYLLYVLSRGSACSCLVRLQMMVALNAQERTLGGFAKLGKETGWNLESMRRGEFQSFLVFAPF